MQGCRKLWPGERNAVDAGGRIDLQQGGRRRRCGGRGPEREQQEPQPSGSDRERRQQHDRNREQPFAAPAQSGELQADRGDDEPAHAQRRRRRRIAHNAIAVTG